MIPLISNAMQPLTQAYGMRAVREDPNPACPTVVFANGTTELEVRVEWRELRPFILVREISSSRLDGGRSGGFSPRVFDADDILLLRSPEEPSPVGKMIGEGGDEAAATLLREYATALHRYAADVFKGDFQVFTTLEEIVAARMRRLSGGRPQ